MRRPFNWNTHLLACARKGMESWRAGLGVTDCPYSAYSKGLNRQRRQYWQHGWIEQDRLLQEPTDGDQAQAGR